MLLLNWILLLLMHICVRCRYWLQHKIGTPPHKSPLKTSQQHSRVTSCVNICVCMLEPQMPAEGSMTPLNTRLYLLAREGGPWQCSSLDQARLETGNHSPSLPIEVCVEAFCSPLLFWEKPVCSHYSEAHAFQTAAMAKKSESAELWSCERHTSPKAPFQDLQTSLTTSALFHARLLPWKRPANGRGSVSHMVTKRVNKSHS